MTEFNQRVSLVAREVIESGEAIRVTNRGRAVLRLVPEPQGDRGALDTLISSGLATPAGRSHQMIGRREPIALSRSLDDVLTEVNADAAF